MKDERPSTPHLFVQWKGTDVCADVSCQCGYLGHVDVDFFYFYQCPACGQKYEIGHFVKIFPITEEEAKIVEHNFHTCELEDDE